MAMAGVSRLNEPANKVNAAIQDSSVVTLPSGASYPTFLEPLTENETVLLKTYEQIRHYEKEAARLKAQKAKRLLDEADERYQRYQAKVRGREKPEGGDDEEAGSDDGGNGGGKALSVERMDGQDSVEDLDESEDEDEEAAERRRKREREITQLKKDVEAQNRKEAEAKAERREEEAKRRAMLGEDDAAGGNAEGAGTRRRPPVESDESDDSDYYGEDQGLGAVTGRSIKKKRVESNPWDEKPKPSLIAKMGGDSTPVHDFSKKLGMSKVSLDGSVLFPHDDNLPWEPPSAPSDPLDGCMELELPDFDSAMPASSNNTIAVKFHAPQESKRFSINIAAPNHDSYNDILFHFNPRHFQRGGQLVINDKKESMWGNGISVPLSTIPLMFGQQCCTLIVQINEEGFDVFVEGQHCVRLEHRTILPKANGTLFLQFPSSDDYGNPENWMVYRVWWGRKASMAKDLNGVAGVNIYSAVHPKKLFVSGLTKLRSDPEVDLRRAELERAFRKYGGPSGAVLVSVQKNSTFAFVEVASEQQADLALLEMASRYRLNKARRTKHEALMEERAAKEAKEKGVVKESVDWD